MAVVGIDLGTSNSVVAIYRRGRAEVLRVDGAGCAPSCVAAKPGGGLLVGQLAKRRASIDPAQTVIAIKRQMGDRDYTVQLDGRRYTPVDISAMILDKLVTAAREQLGEAIDGAVISVPAYFNSKQKEDTRAAGERAGVKVLRLIPEPTAAAIAYGLNKGRDQTILVYDLGGGTFDVSILRVAGNKFQVVGVGGDEKLGGEDFDRRLIDLILNHLRQAPEILGQTNRLDPARLQQQLKESAEEAKKELSSAETVEIEIPEIVPGGSFHLTVSRKQYEQQIQDLVARTIQITRETLAAFRLAPEDIDRVVLVGGSTRIPLVQRMVTETISEPYIAEHVDEVVAHGAAILAAELTSVAEARPDLAPIEVVNATARSLGIRAAGDKFVPVIPRGASLPAQARKVFTTAFDNADRTDVVVFQGEHERCSDNEQIGGFGVVGIERARAGKPQIQVEFELDPDDILTVAARDLGTGRSGRIRIEQFEPQPYEPQSERRQLDIQSLRFGVSSRGCDDAGQVISQMGLRFKQLAHADFRKAKTLQQFDLVFINCLADISQVVCGGLMLDPKANAPALREFVGNGGLLYVSDYALDNITEAFPGNIRFKGKGDGPKGRTTAAVLDPELKETLGGSWPINFDTVYAPVHSVNSNCHVYLARGNEPILVSFPYKKGHVVYTSFHNGVQASDQERKLLMFIVLKTISLATSTPLIELAESKDIRRIS
jgi:molecular chaperone DnaK